ncbi:MAG: hypothetical protein ACFFCW_11545 [Candidatus Hodarchaeota archaeon]
MKMDELFRVFQLNHNHRLTGLLVVISMLLFPSISHGGVLFESSWNTATGTSDKAIFDGGKWTGGYGRHAPKQDPYVSAGGPGGNNFLNMVTVGDRGYGDGHYFNWKTYSSDVFGDPTNLYIRFYWRLHSDCVLEGPTKHWMGNYTQDAHYCSFNVKSGAPFAVEIQHYPDDSRWRLMVDLDLDVWYRWEVHIQEVTGGERWYIRLNGTDITDKFYCLSGSRYGKWLQRFYDGGGKLRSDYHGGFWLTTYDMPSPLNQGWDVACIEVRDDRWPGPAVGDSIPPNPPTGVKVE